MYNNQSNSANAKDANAAKNEFKNKAREVKGEVVDAAYDVKNTLSETAEHVGANIRELYKDASSRARHAADDVAYQIRSNPVRSTAIAAAVGFLLGAIFRRI